MFDVPSSKASWKLGLSKFSELYHLSVGGEEGRRGGGAGRPRPLHLTLQKCLFVFMVIMNRFANVLVKFSQRTTLTGCLKCSRLHERVGFYLGRNAMTSEQYSKFPL